LSGLNFLGSTEFASVGLACFYRRKRIKSRKQGCKHKRSLINPTSNSLEIFQKRKHNVIEATGSDPQSEGM